MSMIALAETIALVLLPTPYTQLTSALKYGHSGPAAPEDGSIKTCSVQTLIAVKVS